MLCVCARFVTKKDRVTYTQLRAQTGPGERPTPRAAFQQSSDEFLDGCSAHMAKGASGMGDHELPEFNHLVVIFLNLVFQRHQLLVDFLETLPYNYIAC